MPGIGSRGAAALAMLLVLVGCQRIDVASRPAGGKADVQEWVVQEAGANDLGDQWGRGTCKPGAQSEFRWIDCRSGGDGSPMLLASTQEFSSPVDVTGHSLHFWIRIDDPAKLGGLELRLASGSFEKGMAAFQIPLYSDPPFNMIQGGVWTPQSFSLGTARIEGEVDLRSVSRVGLYAADNGKGPIRVRWTGLTAVEQAAEGYVSFTFDDGTLSHVEVAAPAMHEHGFRGTAYVMPDEVGYEGFVTTDHLDELAGTYGWDVAAHHAVSFTHMKEGELEPAILSVQSYLRKRGFDAGLGHLAYPLGRQDPKVVRPLVRKHFTTARLASAGPETIPPADPHLLRAVNVLDTTTPEEVGEIALRAKKHGEWAILMFHLLNDDPQVEIAYAIDDFKKALVEVEKTGVKVLPVSEVWDRISGIRTVRGAARPGRGEPRGLASARPSQ
ncbi:MAG: polysaccharide deacetylase family protein [bacterium]|nr:polysaccharide deacetylase family protein [bacterium]